MKSFAQFLLLEEPPAWHGSPHKHDGFSLEFIGKGEGNQAYGYGLYFSSSRKVAEWYRDTLTLQQELNIKGTRLLDEPISRKEQDLISKCRNIFNDTLKIYNAKAPLYSFDNFIQFYNYRQKLVTLDNEHYKLYKNEIEKTISDWKTAIETKNPSYSSEKVIDVLNYFGAEGLRHPYSNAYDAASEELRKNVKKGLLYHVDIIPNDDQFLDWDESIDSQSKYVKEKLSKDESWRFAQTVKGKSGDNGRFVYKDISDRLGSDKAASLYLLSLGIKGIIYLDGVSRSKGRGSYNYVVFDDKDVKIKERL